MRHIGNSQPFMNRSRNSLLLSQAAEPFQITLGLTSHLRWLSHNSLIILVSNIQAYFIMSYQCGISYQRDLLSHCGLQTAVVSSSALSLAAQKFVSDIAADAYQHARIRTNAAGGRSRAAQSGPQAARVRLILLTGQSQNHSHSNSGQDEDYADDGRS